jgi:hypothetical protein
MKVQWNTVTWYSKLLALALFVALPFVGFWYGIQYGELLVLLHLDSSQSAVPATADYYSNVAAWPVDQRPDAGFSIAHPLDFQRDDVYSIAPRVDWRLGSASEPGNLALTVTISRSFEPQTNFADAKLTVGKSGSVVARANCLKSDAGGGPYAGVATTTINGVPFSIFTSAGAGAGNFYETTSYRALHAGLCYAVEYTIHSSQIANYPAEYRLQRFDKNKLTNVLDRIVSTFKFQ